MLLRTLNYTVLSSTRYMSSYDSRRVVVTGLGALTPLGINVKTSWNNLLEKHCAIHKIDSNIDPHDEKYLPIFLNLPSKIAARIPYNEYQKLKDIHFTTSDHRMMSKAMMFGVLAAQEALDDANWHPKDQSSLERTGVAVGNAMVDLDYIAASHDLIRNVSVNKLSPYFVPKILPNLTPGHISIRHGFLGPNHSVSTACATSSHAIGDAFNFIKMNSADVMLAGGVDTCINPLSMAGFCRARALATRFNDNPEASSRPFDQDRDGFVMGEGSSVLVLEELEHAKERKAKIYCELLGYGLSGDGHHITAGRQDGRGALLAMKGALSSVLNATPASTASGQNQLWCINAHATSTPLGDLAELTAIQKLVQELKENGSVLFPSDGRVRITSHKSNMGHLIGACGSAELAFAALALENSKLPGTINLVKQDQAVNEDLVKILTDCEESDPCGTVRKMILKNSFGFGGTNVSLLIAEYKE